jgi:hypothetical protein
VRRLFLLLIFALPGRARAGLGGDQLCAAAGLSAGCIGTVQPGSYSPGGGSRGSREPREPREPACDAACRQREAEDREYALSHIVEPGELPETIDPVAVRTESTYGAGVKGNDGNDRALFAGAMLAGATEDGAVLLGGPLGWLLGGIAAVVIAAPSAHLAKHVPALWDSIPSLAKSNERAFRAAHPAETPPDILRGATGSPEPPDDEDPKKEPERRLKLNREQLEHIKDRHWPDSDAPNAGKFRDGIADEDLVKMLKEAEKGKWGRNPSQPGHAISWEFPEEIGVDRDGNPTRRLWVATTPGGWVITAYPY